MAGGGFFLWVLVVLDEELVEVVECPAVFGLAPERDNASATATATTTAVTPATSPMRWLRSKPLSQACKPD